MLTLRGFLAALCTYANSANRGFCIQERDYTAILSWRRLDEVTFGAFQSVLGRDGRRKARRPNFALRHRGHYSED